MINAAHPWNKMWVGLLLGLAVPFVGYAVWLTFFETLAGIGAGTATTFRPRTMVVLGIFLNIIPLQISQKRKWHDLIRGLGVSTVICAFGWLIYYRAELFNAEG